MRGAVSGLMAVSGMAAIVAVGMVGAFADDPPKKGTEPVKVIELERKEPVSYEKDVEPIFVAKCVVCHSGQVREGKFDISTFETLMRGGKSGRLIVPLKSSESRFVKLIAKTEKPFMPPKSEEPLTPEELALIKLWIDQGAKPPAGVRMRPRPTLALIPEGVVPVRAVAVASDGSVVYASRANQLHAYDPASGVYLRAFEDPNLATTDKKPVKGAHLSLVESLALSPDGKILASGGYGEVALWDAATGQLLRRIDGFADRVVALHFSSDSRFLATGGGAPTEDGEVKILEMPEGKVVADLKNAHSDQVFGVCFSPDDSKIAACGADKFVKVFEVPSGKPLKTFEGHTHHVLDVGWKGDGKLLVSAGADNTLKFWDYEKGEQVRTVQRAHALQVTRLAFVGKTNQFLTCSGDKSAQLWNVDNGNKVRTFGGGKDFLYAVASSSDGKIVVTGGEDGVVRVYNGADAKLLKELLPPGIEARK